MNNKILLLIFSIMLCTQNSCDAKKVPPAPPPDNEKVSQIEWQPEFNIGGEIFPSNILAHPVSLSDGKIFADGERPADTSLPTLSVSVVNPSSQSHIKLEIDIAGLSELSEFEGVLEKEGETYDINPIISWNYQYLAKIKQPLATTAKFNLYINGSLVSKKSMAIKVRSVNDAPIYVNGDYSWIFAAYVNENHPWIDQLLREAINTGTVSHGFVGYQAGEQYVSQQVFAIWNLFQRRGFQYSSITTPTGYSTEIYSQYVRTFEDSINTSQANCVDGSVLFASVLRKIGIDPFLVLIPGHMFLGFYLDEQHKHPVFLETTMMGSTNLKKYSEEDTLDGAFSWLLGVETRNQASANSFNNAIQEGNNNFFSNQQHFINNESGYKFIDIDEQRKAGVEPINR